jgi:branched-chain amino acid transport system substrate-binding protein
MLIQRRALSLLLCGLVAATATQAQKKYDTGATDTEIKIGNTTPYSGPASSYGTIGRALSAYFTMVNEKGGVRGRKINFISLDDAYNPAKSLEQARRLVEQDQVLFMFSNIGTVPALAINKYTNSKKVPMIFPSSGTQQFADPVNNPLTIGFWPSYFNEAVVSGRYIARTMPNAKIALLYLNDDAGREFVKGLKAGLGEKVANIVVEQTVQTTDPTVQSQLITLANSGAAVFVNFATARTAAQAIREIPGLGWKPQLHVIDSAISSIKSVLEPAGLDNAVGLVVPQYLKDPTDPKWKDDPEMVEWRAFMSKYYPSGSQGDYLNVYAYAEASALVKVLEAAGDNLTRENLVHVASRLSNVPFPLALPGITLNTSPNDFSAVKQMQMSRFNGKNWELFGPVIDLNK